MASASARRIPLHGEGRPVRFAPDEAARSREVAGEPPRSSHPTRRDTRSQPRATPTELATRHHPSRRVLVCSAADDALGGRVPRAVLAARRRVRGACPPRCRVVRPRPARGPSVGADRRLDAMSGSTVRTRDAIHTTAATAPGACATRASHGAVARRRSRRLRVLQQRLRRCGGRGRDVAGRATRTRRRFHATQSAGATRERDRRGSGAVRAGVTPVVGAGRRRRVCRGCPLYRDATQTVFGEGSATRR